MVLENSVTKQTDKAKIRAAIEKAFKAGFKEGQAERNAFLNRLQITNHQLWQQLLEMDQTEPVNGIVLSRRLAEKIYNTLPSKNLGVAIQLKKQIKLADRHEAQILRILRIHKLEK